MESLGNMRDRNKFSARNPEMKLALRRLNLRLVGNIVKKQDVLEQTGFI
jgi:hypothetical protein